MSGGLRYSERKPVASLANSWLALAVMASVSVHHFTNKQQKKQKQKTKKNQTKPKLNKNHIKINTLTTFNVFAIGG
jgi:hypothetical protein